MRCSGCFCASTLIGQLSIVVLLLVVESSSSSDSSEHNVASSSRHKRAPGWGKRAGVADDIYMDSDSADDLLQRVAILNKRAPGWGKRLSSFETDANRLAKRAPGWGKRSQDLDQEEDSTIMTEKRAPGWGKRAPGWGKRAPGWGKRAPGWGKRAPGWGKRAPGWGKRSSDECESLNLDVETSFKRFIEAKSRRDAECGSLEDTNESYRK